MMILKVRKGLGIYIRLSVLLSSFYLGISHNLKDRIKMFQHRSIPVANKTTFSLSPNHPFFFND